MVSVHSTSLGQFVKQFFRHHVKGSVMRYELPGSSSLNFVLTKSLGKVAILWRSNIHMKTRGRRFGISEHRSARKNLRTTLIDERDSRTKELDS
jgi:hypothetical protein